MKPHELQMIKTALGKCWEMLRSEGYKKFGCITEAEKIIEKYESQSRLSQPVNLPNDDEVFEWYQALTRRNNNGK